MYNKPLQSEVQYVSRKASLRIKHENCTHIIIEEFAHRTEVLPHAYSTVDADLPHL